jgi:hypothetical protein
LRRAFRINLSPAEEVANDLYAIAPFCFLGMTLQDMPPMLYNDAGACPFECCHYGAWTAQKLVIARQTYESKSAIAFGIKAGEKVTALTVPKRDYRWFWQTTVSAPQDTTSPI